MKVGHKLTWAIGVALIALMGALYATSQAILLKGFIDLEEQGMLRDVGRAQDALAATITDLDRQVSDWSSWDDAYSFVRKGDGEFIKKNLPDDTFTRLRINVMFFVQPTGQMVYAKAFDLGKAQEVPVPSSVTGHIAAHPELQIYPDIKRGHAGIITLPEGPMLIVARPILTSEGQGPLAGTLMMGRYLNAVEIMRLAEMTHLALTLQPPSLMPGGVSSVPAAVPTVSNIDDRTVVGSALLRDIYDRPALILKVSAPRDIYQHGQATIRYFLLWLFGSIGVFAVIVRLVLRKLARTQAEHHAIEARYRAIVEQSAEGMLLVDQKTHRVLDANPALSNLLGYGADEMIALHLRDVQGTEATETDAYVRRVAMEHQHVTHETRYQRKDGSLVDVEAGAKVIMHNGKEVLCIVVRDIAERLQAQERIQYLAHYDALTGLPNRALLADRLNQGLIHAHRNGVIVAVMLLNIDRFKIVNDSLGQHAGDLLLQSISQRLRDTVREGDTVARHGGDEFVVVLGGPRLMEDSLAVGDKMLEALARPFEVNEQELHVTSSIGISLYPGDGKDAETLLKNAGVAMCSAKAAGGNAQRLYAANMSARSFQRFTIENSLRHALERDELSLCYQPQVDLASGRVYGMEALLRWHHPELGQVSPIKFIPVAEETGLIIPIGEWVLRTACRQTQEWRVRGFSPLRVAVNLSARQFAQKNLVKLIAGVLEETGLPPHCLDVELTESMLMDNIADNVNVLREIKGRGVSISIDDFGTGYSSLAYLQRMPIDTMKIDRSFVRDISGPDSQAPIAKAVIALARSLGMETIAEGVETQVQLEFMRKQGCIALQGYYFSQPLSAQDFTALLEEGRILNDVEAAAVVGDGGEHRRAG